MQYEKTALITDLDNTLFDWVELWVSSFSAMLARIVEISGIPEDRLKKEISEVHQVHGTSEYSFLLDEIPSLQEFVGRRQATDVFGEAIAEFRRIRAEKLRLYPTVSETLMRIKGRGSRIVGYTESMAFYSNYRIRALGLDGVLDFVFCPNDHRVPSGLSPEQLLKYPSQSYALTSTVQLFTPKGSRKPDVNVLNSILGTLGVDRDRCVYVGDNLFKDVAMAQDCGVSDVWARYGQAHQRPEYSLLREVTHWTKEEVEREQRVNEREHVTPACTLNSSYSEILDHYQFARF